MADDELQIELQSELEDLQNDYSLPAVDDFNLNDIFSSSEDDYNIFYLNNIKTTTVEEESNVAVWDSYFDQIELKQNKYLNDTKSILSEMNQICTNTLNLCAIDTKPENKTEIIKVSSVSEEKSFLKDDTNDTILQNPFVPSHVTPIPSPIKTETSKLSNTHNENDLFPVIPDEKSPLQKEDIDTSEQHESKTNITSLNQSDIDIEYKEELQRIENEFKEHARGRNEEVVMNDMLTWSKSLIKSRILYEQYLETMQCIQNAKDYCMIKKYFIEWKIEWERKKRKELYLMRITFGMKNLLFQFIDQTVTKHQIKCKRLKKWNNLICRFHHQRTMNQIKLYFMYKVNVINYIINHYHENYKFRQNKQLYFKLNCLPFVYERSLLYKKRRLSLLQIEKWYVHHVNKKKVNKRLKGIHKLCRFKKYHIDNSLKVNIFEIWRYYVCKTVKYRNDRLQEINDNLNRIKINQSICCLQTNIRLKLLKHNLIMFRNTKKQRNNYLISQTNIKRNAILQIQCYFRMFFVRSTMIDVQCKIASIDDMFNNNIKHVNSIAINDSFNELNESEYIFDESIINFDLKPFSNPPSPKEKNIPELQTESEEESDESLDNQTASTSSENELESSDESTNNSINDESQNTKNNFKETKAIGNFKSESVANAWRKRKKKFEKKNKKKNIRSRFNKQIHSFGASNRFQPSKRQPRNGKSKTKFVKFGCPQNN